MQLFNMFMLAIPLKLFICRDLTQRNMQALYVYMWHCFLLFGAQVSE